MKSLFFLNQSYQDFIISSGTLYFKKWILLGIIYYQTLDIIYIYANSIEHNRHFLSTYFLLDPFVLLYCFYRIRQGLIYVLSIVLYIPSTFCSILGHHQGRIYYKSVTFVFAYYYFVRASLPLKSIASAESTRDIYIYIYIYIYPIYLVN